MCERHSQSEKGNYWEALREGYIKREVEHVRERNRDIDEEKEGVGKGGGSGNGEREGERDEEREGEGIRDRVIQRMIQ